MNKYNIIIIILIIILCGGIFAVCNQFIFNNENSNIIPAQASNGTTRELIANSSDDAGSVEVIKNIGNPNGEKIAYVVGVHPLEHETHETLVKLLPKTQNLRFPLRENRSIFIFANYTPNRIQIRM